MNFNNFTIKSQEAVQKAIDLTRSYNQQSIEPAHLMKSILMEGEGIAPFIFLSLTNIFIINLRIFYYASLSKHAYQGGGLRRFCAYFWFLHQNVLLELEL